MARRGRQYQRHMIDGREMTAPEIAAMLGISTRALYVRHTKMHGCGYQAIVDLYRAGAFNTKADRRHRHKVDGAWITDTEAARRLGIHVQQLRQYRYRRHRETGRRPTLEEAVRHYERKPRWGGSEPKRELVDGQWMSTREAAEAHHTNYEQLKAYKYNNHCSLQEAVDRLEQRRMKKAEREIMKILIPVAAERSQP